MAALLDCYYIPLTLCRYELPGQAPTSRGYRLGGQLDGNCVTTRSACIAAADLRPSMMQAEARKEKSDVPVFSR